MSDANSTLFHGASVTRIYCEYKNLSKDLGTRGNFQRCLIAGRNLDIANRKYITDKRGGKKDGKKEGARYINGRRVRSRSPSRHYVMKLARLLARLPRNERQRRAVTSENL